MVRASILFVVASVACSGNGDGATRKDMGPCIAIVQEGKDYWLCEKLSTSTGGPTVPTSTHRAEAERVIDEAERARDESTAAKRAKEAAERIAQRVVADAEAAHKELERRARELEALDERVRQAVDRVIAAENDSERDLATAKLKELQREVELAQRITAAKVAAEQAEPDATP